MTGMAWAGRLGIVIAIIIIERASPALAWFLVALAAAGTVCAFVYNSISYQPQRCISLIGDWQAGPQIRAQDAHRDR